MTTRTDPPPRLIRALQAGALYDWILGLVILAAHPAIFRLFQTPPPADLFLFRMNALALFLLGLFYWALAANPTGWRWTTRLAINIRFLGGLFLLGLTAFHRPEGWPTYMAFGLADIAWGTLWLVLLSRQ
ncbi:MAG: hypothetical protein FD129_431 [bacterium]|nr:MAG: hypothetical protein FD129_431 [bacterium]